MHEIEMSGPGKNSLGTGMMTFLLDRLRAAGGGPVLLTGAGDAFSAGLNLIEISQLDVSGMHGFLRQLEEMVATYFAYPGPIVACVNGHAIAGGCILALACDYRVVAANPKIKIGLNETAIGLRFPPRTLALARSRIPAQHLRTILLGAGLHGPLAAAALGLVDEVAEDARAVARARLEALAAHPPAVYAASKRDLLAGVDAVSAEDERRFVEEVLPVWTGPEVKQRILAVLKK